MFGSAGCFLLTAKGFACSLNVLYGGLGISKLQFLIKKIGVTFFSALKSFSFFGQKIWMGTVFSLKSCRIQIRTQWIRIRNAGPVGIISKDRVGHAGHTGPESKPDLYPFSTKCKDKLPVCLFQKISICCPKYRKFWFLTPLILMRKIKQCNWHWCE